MAFATPANIAITGAGNQTTGFNAITSIDLTLSAAGTLNLRETSGAGTIVASAVFGAAGTWSRNFDPPLLCRSGVFFIENTAGNVAGGVSGFDLAT